MIDRPRTRYVQAGSDGLYMAYQVFGQGPFLTLFGGYNVEGVWALPPFVAFLERVSTFARIVLSDPRGLGIADRFPDAVIPPLEEWAMDAITVQDAVRADRTFLLSDGQAAQGAMLMAATFPDRVAGLVLVNPTARRARASDYEIGVEPRLRGFDPDAVRAPTDRYDDALQRRNRLVAEPRMMAALFGFFDRQDVRSLLPLVQAPTLVLQRRETRPVGPEHGRFVADHIPGASYVELDGSRPGFAGEPDVADHLERFMQQTGAVATTDRVLATVLFTDIVSSTERAASEGDERWRRTLDRHDAISRSVVDGHRGRWVKQTGDGVLATFDGPARAVQCAVAMREALAAEGIVIRAGLHTGEVTGRGDDIAGLAVVMARRICDLAGQARILVSRTVHDLTIGSRIALTEHGTHELKGVPGEWTVHEVV